MDVTFLHGLGQSSKSWTETISRLPKTIHANCFDLFPPGGRIGYSELYHAFETRCGTVPQHLCGLSLGAVVALNFAIDHGKQVESLVLIAPQYKMPRVLLKVQNLVFQFLPEKSFAETGLNKQDLLYLTSSMKALDFRQKLEQISCPVMIVCGEKDRANQKAARELAGKIPGAKLRILKNAGHEANKDAPAELAALLSSFYEPF